VTTSDTPPSDEAMLAHFGVKGMKWGQRKAQLSEAASRIRNPTGREKATVAAGAAAVAVLMHKTGTLMPTMALTGRLAYNGSAFVAEKGLNMLSTPVFMPYFWIKPLGVGAIS
jgi:hypothetical protein